MLNANTIDLLGDAASQSTSHHYRSVDGLTLHYRDFEPVQDLGLTPAMFGCGASLFFAT